MYHFNLENNAAFSRISFTKSDNKEKLPDIFEFRHWFRWIQIEENAQGDPMSAEVKASIVFWKWASSFGTIASISAFANAIPLVKQEGSPHFLFSKKGAVSYFCIKFRRYWHWVVINCDSLKQNGLITKVGIY
jgi:hypothetical protein